MVSVLIMLLITGVLTSLFFGLFYLYHKDRADLAYEQNDKRAVKFLTLRVVCSFILFTAVLLSFISERIIAHV